MGIAALVCGIIGGLCAVMGIVTAAGVDITFGDEFTPLFWLALGTVLLLGSIAFAVSREPY